jgi:hypothetical protein
MSRRISATPHRKQHKLFESLIGLNHCDAERLGTISDLLQVAVRFCIHAGGVSTPLGRARLAIIE